MPPRLAPTQATTDATARVRRKTWQCRRTLSRTVTSGKSAAYARPVAGSCVSGLADPYGDARTLKQTT